MKLLLVIPYFYPKIGGLENYALNIMLGLRQQYGYDIVVVAGNHRERAFKKETVKGMTVYRLPYWFKASNTPVNPGWIFDLYRIIKEEKPDVINGHTPVPFISDMAALVSKITGIPFILTYQNDLEKSSPILIVVLDIYSNITRLTLGIAKSIIVTTKYFFNESKLLQPYKKKIAIIPPGVDPLKGNVTATEMQKSVTRKKKVVLFVGSMDKTHVHKGVDYLIDAIGIVAETMPEVRLVAVGKGDAIPNYKRKVKGLGIEENVYFTGYVPDAELHGWYQECDVCVLPSTNNSEGFGMVLIEAGLYKKPVIASKIGGMPYVVDDGKTGYLVKPKNAKSLAQGILKILSDTITGKKLGEQNYHKVMNGYLWKHQVAKTHELFSRYIYDSICF